MAVIPSSRYCCLLFGLLLAAASCQGAATAPDLQESTPGGGSGGGPSGQGGAGKLPPVPASCDVPSVEPAPLRRISNREFDNTLRDLFADAGVDLGTPSALGNLPADRVEHIFDNEAAGRQVTTKLARSYAKAAEKVAALVTADPPRLLGCTPSPGTEEACVGEFIDRFGARAYRRPLEPDERQRLLAAFQKDKADHGVDLAVGMMIERIIQSPQFLYRVEFGLPEMQNGVHKLSPYELATRLSYTFWSTMPDQALFDAAASGALATAEQVRQQAARLFDEQRSRKTLASFFQQWLQIDGLTGLSRDDKKFPDFGEGQLALMRTEAEMFAEHIAYGGVPWRQLFQADYSFLNKDLANHYGLSGLENKDFERITLPQARSGGLLTLGLVPTIGANEDRTSPVLRGLFVRYRLLCTELPEPPADVPPFPENKPGLTTRQLNELHTEDPSCKGCHELLDPLGLGFERFDPVGRIRDTEDGLPIDDSGELTGTGDSDGPYVGVPELAARLAGSEFARSCIAKQMFTFVAGRAPGARDRCSHEAVADSLASADGTFRDAFLTLTTSPAFLYTTTRSQ